MSVIREVNAYRLEPELLEEAMCAYAEAHEAATGVDDLLEVWTRSICAAMDAAGLGAEESALAALAAQLRISALSKIISAEGAKGFRYPLKPGQQRLTHELVRCAAEEPLLERDGPVAFDSDSFHRRLLTIAAPAGRS